MTSVDSPLILYVLAVAAAKYTRKEHVLMSDAVHNVALLYLLNQDTHDLSPDELYSLYRETLNTIDQCEKRYQESHKTNPFSFG